MDPLVPTQPIQRTENSFSEKKQLSTEKKGPTDSKIKGFVLEKIGHVVSRGALLPSAAAPRVMIDLLSALAIPAIGDERIAPFIEPLSFSRRRKRQPQRKTIGKMVPVGLRRCKPYEWINAWIQFLLFLPSIPELFSFLPREFELFREFAEQYAWDQVENKVVSFANSTSLMRCLLRMLPPRFFRNSVDLYELLQLFAERVFPGFSYVCDSALFHSKWHLIWDPRGDEPFEESFCRKVKSRPWYPKDEASSGTPPSEILVAIEGWKNGVCHLLKKQIFFPSQGLCYDLNAFIERRGEAYIAYVKAEGTWYQCDDERVTPLLSTILNVPLHRAILLHYRKISLLPSL